MTKYSLKMILHFGQILFNHQRSNFIQLPNIYKLCLQSRECTHSVFVTPLMHDLRSNTAQKHTLHPSTIHVTIENTTLTIFLYNLPFCLLGLTLISTPCGYSFDLRLL